MLKKRESSRSKVSTEINAGSMADIAFLLLIFFLVTTTIEVDKGILVRLPPWSEEPPETAKIKEKNLLPVLINANEQLLVRGEEMDINMLKDKVVEFITNPQQQDNYPATPQEAIVSLQNDRGTKYEAYINVYNELQAAYNQLRNEEAERKHGTIFDNLTREQRKEIIDKYPMKLSEAEPTEFGREENQ